MPRTHLTEYDAEALRAQILDNQIAVDALSYETARALLAYEIDRTETDNCGEPTVLDALLQRLDGTDMFDHAHEVVPPERYDALVYQATAPQPMRRMPLLKKIILIAAAVILLSSLGVTVYASYLGPFEGFVDNIKDLFGIEVGEVITNGDSQLTVDANPRYYTDFEALMMDCEYDILFPRGIKPDGERPVRMYYTGKSLHIFAQYNNVMFEAYLTNIPFTEEVLTSQAPNAEKFIVNGHTYYYVSSSPTQYNLFYNDQLYIIHADTHADFLAIAEHMEKPS